MALSYLDQQGLLNSQLQRKGFSSAINVGSFDGRTEPFILFRDSGLAAHGGFLYLQKIIEAAETVEELFGVCDRENNLSLTSLSRSA